MGCDFAQGYYYATPRTLGEIEPLARAGTTATGLAADPSSTPDFRDGGPPERSLTLLGGSQRGSPRMRSAAAVASTWVVPPAMVRHRLRR